MSGKEIKPGAVSKETSTFKKLKSKKEKGYDVYKESGPSDNSVDVTDSLANNTDKKK